MEFVSVQISALYTSCSSVYPSAHPQQSTSSGSFYLHNVIVKYVLQLEADETFNHIHDQIWYSSMRMYVGTDAFWDMLHNIPIYAVDDQTFFVHVHKNLLDLFIAISFGKMIYILNYTWLCIYPIYHVTQFMMSHSFANDQCRQHVTPSVIPKIAPLWQVFHYRKDSVSRCLCWVR